MEKKYNSNKFVSFLKKNIYYILMIACILAIGAMITIAAINGSKDDPNVVKPSNNTENSQTNKPEEKPDKTEKPTSIVFEIPVANAELGMDYSIELPVYSATLNQWAAHTGLDLLAEEGSEVKSAYNGVVKSITTDDYNGTVITIAHDNGLETSYSSLDEEISVIRNQVVSKGDVIGKCSTCLSKASEGAMCHFEVKLNGKYANPHDYLPEELK